MVNKFSLIIFVLFNFSKLNSQQYLANEIDNLLGRLNILYGSVYFAKVFEKLEYRNYKDEYIEEKYEKEFSIVKNLKLKKVTYSYDVMKKYISKRYIKDSQFFEKKTQLNRTVGRNNQLLFYRIDSMTNASIKIGNHEDAIINANYTSILNENSNVLIIKSEIKRIQKKALILNQIFEGDEFYLVLYMVYNYENIHDSKFSSEIIYK